MSFDLLVNPFAVLGLAGGATVNTISTRARQLGSAEASVASRILISPRTRLAAELSFFPGATQEQVDEWLEILRKGGGPDLWSLMPIARANVLAHMASSGSATPSQLRDLVGMQETAPSTAMEAVNRGRTEARMPPVPPDMEAGALQFLAGQHAEALVDGILANKNGAEFLMSLLRDSGSAVTPRGIFLRQCTAGWDRAKTADMSRILESAEPLETTLREHPEAVSAQKLANVIQELALATRPQREVARLLGLPYELSMDARQRWQSVALDLNNRLDAVPEAVTVFEALVSGFDEPDEHRERIVRNLQVCRDRLAAGDGTPEIRRLMTAITAATTEPADFVDCGLIDGRKTLKCPAIVAELHDSFVAATEKAITDLPWSMLRTFSLLLHNEHSATPAAWSLTVLAIAQANRNSAGRPILSLLTGDKRNLRSQMLQRDFEVAVSSKRKGALRTIVAELVTLADTPVQKAEYAKLLRKLRTQAVFSYLKWGFWAAVAGLVMIEFLSKEQTPVRTATVPSPTPFPSTIPAPAVTLQIDLTATQPVPGSSPLSISGLRWCRFQQDRADGAKAYLEALRPDPTIKVDRFNAAVAVYNAFVQPLDASCGNYTYRKSDASIIDAEVGEQRVALAAAGRRLVESVYLAATAPASLRSPVYTPTPTYPPPAPIVPQAWAPSTQQADSPLVLLATAAYTDGQNDRRAWEAWIGSTSGATRDGAEWWAGVRSTQRPPSCSAVPGGSDQVAAAAGCNQARLRLGNSDRRRRSEPDYRTGWNAP